VFLVHVEVVVGKRNAPHGGEDGAFLFSRA
ncbi:uncharacterized protein METZ01_LOCUS508285, partial [marine metagenome]